MRFTDPGSAEKVLKAYKGKLNPTFKYKPDEEPYSRQTLKEGLSPAHPIKEDKSHTDIYILNIPEEVNGRQVEQAL